jgi:lipoate-protein ligase A
LRTIINRSTDPFYNQAFEEVVFQSFPEEEVFFLWRNRPAVVVGCYQNICREVSVTALEKLSVPVIRRMSGGGTVYHDLGNVNYTLITRQSGPIDYDRCLNPVIEALNAIGVPARKNRASDIAIGEGKISGSAQRSAGGRVLHHGTLLFDADLNVLDHITTHRKNDCFRSKGTDSAVVPVTNIRPHLAQDMDIDQFQERLLAQLVAGEPLTLTEEQQAEVIRLRDEKYQSWQWTWGKTPPFVYEKEGVFAGSPIKVTYSAKRGTIYDAAIYCAAIDGEKAAALLNGARYDPMELRKICQTLAFDRGEELLELML